MQRTEPCPSYVMPLSALDRGALARAGGKAANLGELVGAGFPVPPGFCVTTAAYERVTESAAATLAPILDALAQGGAGLAPAALERLADAARAALAGAPLPDALRQEIAAAYRALGADVPVAVRSSATAEDLPDASFAGQQDTYLNVVGEAALADAVRRCFASLWTQRAVTYRATHGIDPRAVRLAVVVQELVPARVAGVLFTADPVSGRRRRAVLDASPGLGEAVVSGAVDPDHFEVDTAALAEKPALGAAAIVARRLGGKTVSIEAIEGGGTRRVTTAAASEPCLSDAQILALAQLGTRVEAHYGTPQDLEWAIDAGGALWLLQARPVTTLYPLPAGARADADTLRVYLNFNVAQGVLRPLTPLGRQCIRLLMAGVADLLGFGPADLLDGPAGLTESAQRLLIDLTAPLRSTIGRRLLRFAFARMEARSHAMLDEVLADPRLSVQPVSAGTLVRIGLGAFVRARVPQAVVRAWIDPAGARVRCAQALRAGLARGDVAAGADAQALLAAAERLLSQGMRGVFPAVMPTFAAGMLALQVARQLLGDRATEEDYDVALRALPHNPTTEMDLALWALAARLRDDPEAKAALLENTAAALAAAYQKGTLPAAIRDGLAPFLARYGARGVAEIDAGVARWGEDPTHLLGSLKNYLALPEGAATPAAQFARARSEAEAKIAELCTRVTGPRRALLQLALGRMRALAGMREAPKFAFVQLLSRARALFLGVGQALCDAGRLEAPADVFMLDLRELRRAVAGADLRPRVAESAAVFSHELTRRHLPRILLSDGTEPSPPAAASAGLSGTPASAGTVRGTARVVLEPNGAQLSPGEILVAPSTDPGWTPLFLTAGGLVMEMGGAMSHGAVVAREYGIPAVVGVAHATERVQSGQTLTVDGTRGTVRLDPETEH